MERVREIPSLAFSDSGRSEEPSSDVVIEVTTPTNLMDDLLERIQDDFRRGSKLVCVIWPRHNLMHLHVSQERIRVFPLNGHTFESLGWKQSHEL